MSPATAVAAAPVAPSRRLLSSLPTTTANTIKINNQLTPLSKAYSRSLFSSSSTLRMAHMVEGCPPLRLLLIGSPGAGKGTQSGRIQNNFEVSTISSGDLLRKNIAQGTEIGKRAAKEMKNGAFVSDEVMVKLIDSELGKLGAEQGWLLDGFPRTMTQAQTLDHTLESLNQPLNLVIHLNVPEEVILQRIMDRWVHIPSGRVYNMTYNPPKRAGVDDVTGEPLERRPDDNPETFKIRLQKHHELTEPLLDYYKNKNILVSLAGNTSDEIYPQIRDLLQTRFKPEDSSSEIEGQGQA
ncbi:hypothetical protein BG015_000529 [Linnemannia schmuckeri]|uniref:GTP:AMP phosphotransferase, mitochondrial n=1 Tax=Linnemannia schmuckeri TaxID=64567 RepID=A0A9P5RUG7_9FUNG|nr:hypothetical protein BG015_000529 [Linnemannia schmuckeri]